MNYRLMHALINAPYTWWHAGTWGEGAPFYTTGANSQAEVFERGINCAGLVNLFMLENGYSVPPVPGYPGGTYAYYKVYKNSLNRFNATELEPGDILLNRYKNKNQQGHVAIYLGQNKIIEATPTTGVAMNDLYEFEYALKSSHFLK